MITLTPKAQQVITASKKIAQDNNHRFISTEHLMIAITEHKKSQAIDALVNAGVDLNKLNKFLFGTLDVVVTSVTDSEITFSPKAQRAINEAAIYVNKFDQSYVGTEHLLLGILDSESDNIHQGLKKQNVSINDVRLCVLDILKDNSDRVAKLIEDHLDKVDDTPVDPQITQNTKQDGEKSLLALFTRDLTMMAQEGKLPPIVGREHEIERSVEVLMRYSKNNPIFVGDAGVGKTAVVEGLAQRIVSGNVPDQLLSKSILQLDLPMLVAGTRYRGDLEERIKMLLQEIQQSDDNIIFIDEIHMIVGAGSADNSMDIGNILKPALSRGEMTCIGATTMAEYRQYIESDSALQRRFQNITVEEPDVATTVDILKGIKHKYEKHHNVKYSITSLKNMVDLADRFITDRNFPDKAIDVMDEIGSHVRAKIFNEIFDNDIDAQLNKLEKDKIRLITAKDYDQANEIKKEQAKLLEQYDALYTSWLAKQSKATRIKDEDVLNYMSNITGMPITRLQLQESSRLKNLKRFLNKRIIGQDQATSVMSSAIKRSRVGLSDPDKPICSFLFLGPTGVGKTHSARIMSEYLFHNKHIIQINMSECHESHSISKLIGAPPGYVGYGDTGLLTEGVKRNPYSVVLLDEIEKAHPDVIQVLLQLLEEGTVADSTGETINFRNTIVIMTGNIGSEFLSKPTTVGFMGNQYEDDNARDKVNEELVKFFKPELINRIDEIVVFDNLTKQHMVSIAKLHARELCLRLKKRNITIAIDDSVFEFIVDTIDTEKFGARPVKRSIMRHVEDKICDQLIDAVFDPSKYYHVHVSMHAGDTSIKLKTSDTRMKSRSNIC